MQKFSLTCIKIQISGSSYLPNFASLPVQNENSDHILNLKYIKEFKNILAKVIMPLTNLCSMIKCHGSKLWTHLFTLAR